MLLKKIVASLTGAGLLAVSVIWLSGVTPLWPKKSNPQTFPPVVSDKPAPMPSPLSFENTTRFDAAGHQIVTNPSHILVLVNKTRNLPPDFVPEDLVAPQVPFPFTAHEPRRFMRREAALALEHLFAAAEADGLRPYALSGFRAFERQYAIFAAQVKRVGETEANRTVARAGQSEHQTGLAMDITSREVGFTLTVDFGATPEGVWLAANAHRFGFVVRYPEGKEHITGYSFEPWHIRYVGTEIADYLFKHSLTLEEYFQQKYGFGVD
ncbi:MAG: putative carboxypeptidase YodJ [Firmicutes bacterium]|nr:putative carboxypeptidase YodJ [Bacillota bacterium]